MEGQSHYINDKYGFELNYPETWRYYENQAWWERNIVDTIVLAPQEDIEKMKAIVDEGSAFSLKFPITINFFAGDIYEDEVFPVLSADDEYGTVEMNNTEVGGKYAKEIRSILTVDEFEGFEVGNIAIDYVIPHQEGYLIIGSHMDKYKDVLKDMVDSILFTN